MRPYTTFRTREDYTVPLLELLASLPGHQAKRRTVLALFEAEYRALIPAEHRGPAPDGRRSVWGYWLDWQRRELTHAGMLDMPRRGVWRITAASLRWLQENPLETHLQPLRPDAPWAGRVRQKVDQEGKVVRFHIRGHDVTLSAEHVLAVAREALAAGLPPEAARYRSWSVVVDGQRISLKWLFRQATGLESFNTSHARDILERRLGFECVQEEQPGPIRRRGPRHPGPGDEEAVWLGVARREVRAVRDVLAGRSDRPSDERLCDMVQFCYTFGLYREAWGIFLLVDGNSVNPWLYDRTRRLAAVCRAKANC